MLTFKIYEISGVVKAHIDAALSRISYCVTHVMYVPEKPESSKLWVSLRNLNLPPEHMDDLMTKKIIHASTLDFFLELLGLADSAGSGEPGGSVGGLGALSTSGSGSRGMEGPLETSGNNNNKKNHPRLIIKWSFNS